MNNLKKLRLKRKLTVRELGQATNINYATISRIENGDSSFNNEYIKTFCDFFGVSADYLLGLPSNAISYNDGTFKNVKILGSVCAGDPKDADDCFLGYLPAKVDSPDDYFYLEISGDSMAPTFIDGDYVLVKYQQTADNNDVVVAGLNGNEATVKRYRELGSDKYLLPDNDEYEAIKLEEELNPYIMGVVSGYFRTKMK